MRPGDRDAASPGDRTGQGPAGGRRDRRRPRPRRSGGDGRLHPADASGGRRADRGPSRGHRRHLRAALASRAVRCGRPGCRQARLPREAGGRHPNRRGGDRGGGRARARHAHDGLQPALASPGRTGARDPHLGSPRPCRDDAHRLDVGVPPRRRVAGVAGRPRRRRRGPVRDRRSPHRPLPPSARRGVRARRCPVGPPGRGQPEHRHGGVDERRHARLDLRRAAHHGRQRHRDLRARRRAVPVPLPRRQPRGATELRHGGRAGGAPSPASGRRAGCPRRSRRPAVGATSTSQYVAHWTAAARTAREGAPPPASLDDGLRALDVVLAAIESADGDAVVVPCQGGR